MSPGGPGGFPGRLPIRLACGDRPTLVVEAASPSEGQLDLGPAVLEVQGQGHQRERLLLGAPHELVDLGAVQQKLASAVGFVGSEGGSVLVGRDVHPVEPHLAGFDTCVRVLKRSAPGAQRLHLGPLQDDAALEDLEQVVLVTCPSVARHWPGCVGVFLTALSATWSLGGHLLRRVSAPSSLPIPSGPMLRLPASVSAEMVAHCLGALPEEGCGLLAGEPVTGSVTTCYPTRNTAASAKLYTVDPSQHLRADRDAEAKGQQIVGVFHSHTHTDAYPSPTDVAQAPDPEWHYVVVSLRDTHPVVRSYRILAGQVLEEPVVVVPGR
jgi:[CysO sulfur-carrier protein]-S-L-cysteine hydrolase